MKDFMLKILSVVLLFQFGFGDTKEEGLAALNAGNNEKAFKLFQKSCDEGDVFGCAHVGMCYEYGTGVHRDFEQALIFFNFACLNGSQYSCDLQNQVKQKMPICSKYDINFEVDNRYVDTKLSTTAYPYVYIDKNTIKIDKANKTIFVWIVWIASSNSRNENIRELGNKYTNYGYRKVLYLIDYKNNRTQFLETVDYSCNNDVIASVPGLRRWQSSAPDSIIEGVTNFLVSKYNLK